MKRIAIMALLLMMGTAYAQNKVPLIKADEEAFVEQAANVNQEEYNKLVPFAKEAFQQYCKNKKLQVTFTEADYKQAVDSIRNYYKPAVAAKDKFASEKTELEKTVARKNHVIDSLQNQVINPLKKGAENESFLRSQISNQNNQINAQNRKVHERDSIISVREAEIVRLNADTTELSTAKRQLEREKNQVDLAYKALENKYDSVLKVLNQQNLRNDTLNESIGKYRVAFKSAENTIDRIYKANQNMPLMAMITDSLNRASTTFESMEFMLKTDPDLYSKLSREVGEIKAWNALKKALDEGIVYMQGKYDNAKRQQSVKTIQTAMKKANLSKVQENESQNIIDNLNNQAEVHTKCVGLMKKLVDEIYLLETSKDATKALAMIGNTEAELKGKLSDYHIKHKEALAALRELFTQASTDISKNKMNTADGFEKAVNNIKSKFQ